MGLVSATALFGGLAVPESLGVGLEVVSAELGVVAGVAGVVALVELGVAPGVVAEPGVDALEIALDGAPAPTELDVAAGVVAEPGVDALEIALDGALAPTELDVAAGVAAELDLPAGVAAEPGVDGRAIAMVGAVAGMAEVIRTPWAVAGARRRRGAWLMAWLATGAPVAIAAAVRTFARIPVAPSPATPPAAT
jgi:hypothetical protein